MAIARYPVECPGCSNKIVLRLAVGHDNRQPFFYVCPRCRAATRGALLWHGGADTSLELSDGRQLESEDGCDTALSINPEFPSVADTASMAEPGGSAFLMFATLLTQEGIISFQRATGILRSVIKSNWAALSRLTTYYINRDWPYFDKGLETLVPPKERDLSENWKREDIIHRLYDLLLIPLLVLDKMPYYPTMKTGFNSLWIPTRPNFSKLVTFAKAEAGSDALKDMQRDIFDHIGRYVIFLNALLPGLLCNMLPPEHQPKVDALRLFRDDYELLRDLYIQSFETCHKALRWILGTVNTDAHADPNRFVAPQNAPESIAKNLPHDLDGFSKLVNAEKRKWLLLLPEWDQHWDMLLDRHLRNDIGHASARHDLSTGLIHREENPPLAYTRFVQCVQRTIHALLATVNALKILRIYSTMDL